MAAMTDTRPIRPLGPRPCTSVSACSGLDAWNALLVCYAVTVFAQLSRIAERRDWDGLRAGTGRDATWRTVTGSSRRRVTVA
jgi:hypothetical protein